VPQLATRNMKTHFVLILLSWSQPTVAIVAVSRNHGRVTRSSTSPTCYNTFVKEHSRRTRRLFQSLSEQTESSTTVRIIPSRVNIGNLSVQYPVTWQRILFSSEPRRPYALQNVTLDVSSQFVFLQGDSQSGKSTLLKAISSASLQSPSLGHNAVMTGTIALGNNGLDANVGAVVPVYVDSKPSYGDGSVAQVIQQKQEELVDCCSRNSRGVREREAVWRVVQEVWRQYSNILYSDRGPLDLAASLASLPISEVYKLHFLLAAWESSVSGGIPPDGLTGEGPTGVDDASEVLVHVPAPIVLLDEWMDTETTETIRLVQDGIEKFTSPATGANGVGAVVLCVTHKTERWRLKPALSQALDNQRQASVLTMAYGKIVQRLSLPKPGSTFSKVRSKLYNV
jgi:hypothetical protein